MCICTTTSLSLHLSMYIWGEGCKILNGCACMHARSFQLCPTLCDPKDCCQPGSSVHGILQARILEWVAMPSSSAPSHTGIKPESLTSPGSLAFFPTWEAQMSVVGVTNHSVTVASVALFQNANQAPRWPIPVPFLQVQLGSARN